MSKSTISKRYTFNWKGEDGCYQGWNFVDAFSKGEARKKALAMESPARDIHYKVYISGNSGPTEMSMDRNKGLYVNMDTLKRVSNESFHETWKRSYQD